MAEMLKGRTRTKAAAAAVLLLASLATSLPAQAEDLVMFRDRVPSAGELANLLWPKAAPSSRGQFFHPKWERRGTGLCPRAASLESLVGLLAGLGKSDCGSIRVWLSPRTRW